MDTCKRCEGTGKADPLMGETAGTSFNCQTQEQIWAVALDQASKGNSTMFDRLVSETGAAFKLLPEDQQKVMLERQRAAFTNGPRGERQAWTKADVDAMTSGQIRFAEKILGIAQSWMGGSGAVYTLKAMSYELAVRIWDEPANPDLEELQHLRQEVAVLRRQRMAPERERELLEANNRQLQAARDARKQLAYAEQRRDYYIDQAQGLALQVYALGGKPEAETPDPWVQRCAWIAERLLDSFPIGIEPQRGEDGLALSHLLFMTNELRARKVGSGTKSCRWLGWLQAGVCFHGLMSLEQMKELNLASGGIERESQGSFQDRNLAFINEVAGDDPTDLQERRDRFLEEALELVQALGLERNGAMQLLHYVFDREVGEPAQEMGGTMVTLAGLASFAGLDMAACGEAELTRCNTPEVIAKIRAKRAGRVKGSPLPGDYNAT